MRPFQALQEIVLSRRTSKNFDGGEIPEALLEDLVSLAVWAPNHRMNEPWRFRVMTATGVQRWMESLRNRLAPDEITLFEKYFVRLAKVPAVILVTCLRDSNELIDLENYAATCAAVQNILLGATALQLQSYWNTGRMMTHPMSLEFFSISEGERFVGALWLGRGEIPEPKRRAPISEKTIWYR